MSTGLVEDQLGQWLTTVAVNDPTIAAHFSIRPTVSPDGDLLALAHLGDLRSSSAAPIELGDTLAEGGMGLVKLATQVALGRTVVVKTLREGAAATSGDSLLREAWATGALEHPNVVPVYDIRISETSNPLIVLRRIEGRPWSDFIRSPNRVLEELGETDLLEWNLGVLETVCQAVRFAHSRKILHRDIKPDNVMIGAFGEIYVVDWGIAASLSTEGDVALPRADSNLPMAGTPCYMAPEMLGGALLSERTDVYLLGATLCEILTGAPPHWGETGAELVLQICLSNPHLPIEAPPELRELCLRAMDKDPQNRIESAGDFLRELQHSRQRRGSASLVAEAQRSVHELDALLRAPEQPPRHELYRVFGAARFAFREALESWPENREAEHGLKRAIELLAEHELSQGDAAAADALLAELPVEEEELRSRVREALAAQVRDRKELERMRRDQSLVSGSRSRWAIAFFLGSFWTVCPLLSYLGIGPDSFSRYSAILEMMLFFSVMVCGLLYWARESVMGSSFNRRLTLHVFLVFPGQAALLLGSWLGDTPIEQVHSLLLFYWGVIVMMSISIDWRLVFAAVGFFAAFLASVRWPDSSLFLMSGGNLVLTLNVLVIWYPRRAHYG